MNKCLIALAFALSVLPISAAAQDTGAQPPTDAQRQAMRQQMQQFMQQEQQLHDQMRSQILSSLSSLHRRAIAADIGNLAVSENPDPDAVARQIDSLLSPGERARIMAAHQNFVTQTKQLHEQMRAAMQNMMPDHPMPDRQANQKWQPRNLDAGHILLGALAPHPHGMMGMMGMPHMNGGEGPPPPPQ